MQGIRALIIDPQRKIAEVRSYETESRLLSGVFGISADIRRRETVVGGERYTVLSRTCPRGSAASVVDRQGKVFVHGKAVVVSSMNNKGITGISVKDVGHLMEYIKSAVKRGSYGDQHKVLLAESQSTEEVVSPRYILDDEFEKTPRVRRTPAPVRKKEVLSKVDKLVLADYCDRLINMLGSLEKMGMDERISFYVLLEKTMAYAGMDSDLMDKDEETILSDLKKLRKQLQL